MKYSRDGWIVAMALVAIALASRAFAQQAPPGAPRGLRLEFPDGVDLRGLSVRYYLRGSFGAFGGAVDPRPDVRSYDVSATVPYFRDAGKLATSMRMMIYVPGYRFVLLADSGFGDGPPKTVRVPLEPLSSVALDGKVSGIADTRNLSVEIFYLAYWGSGYFGYIDGAVPQFKIPGTPLRADGSFTAMVPDFARDPVVWRSDALPPGTFAFAHVQQDTTDRGVLSLRVLDARTEEPRYDLVTTLKDGVDWDLAIAQSYPSPVAFLAMQSVDFPGYLSAAVRSKVGQRFTYNCMTNSTLVPVGKLFGTDTYTEDSGVCAAAAHAGLFAYHGGGPVTIEIRPGQSSYTGSTRNGVTSATKTGGSPHSFIFVR